MAETSVARAPAPASTSTATPACDVQISIGSCSTQPGCGKICRNSRCATALIPPSRSNRIARELVVPWSKARMYGTESSNVDRRSDGNRVQGESRGEGTKGAKETHNEEAKQTETNEEDIAP